jgi:hypothetical protein
MKGWMRDVVVLLAAGLLFSAYSVQYTLAQLSVARSRGVYDTPQAAIDAWAERGYTPDARVVIERAVPNDPSGGLPHHWYVIFRIYATAHKDGTPLYHGEYDSGGWNFVQAKDGWVFLKESQFPSFVAWWMQILNLDGEKPATIEM